MIAIVQYRIGTYTGEVRVFCDPDDETETVIATAKRIVRNRSGGSLPPGSESWKEVSREEESDAR